MTNRYIVVRPVSGGYPYYDIADTQSEIYPNFAVVTIHRDTPGAEQITLDVCESLNGEV